jgi:hypothetical protein
MNLEFVYETVRKFDFTKYSLDLSGFDEGKLKEQIHSSSYTRTVYKTYSSES